MGRALLDPLNAILGLDIGGANLKAAHLHGPACSRPFALWQTPQYLPSALRLLLAEMPPARLRAVTMTGELCDCFASKREGVLAILDAVEQAAGGVPMVVWRSDGLLVDLATARSQPLLIAAANWLALATFAARYIPDGAGLLIDIGSTTTDIIPLLAGRPVPQGRTDPERLASCELVYTGVRRTPLCAILGLEGAAELFSTTLDIHLLLGSLREEPDNHHTADGRPATRAASHVRLARMLCADLETSTLEQRLALARRLAERQVQSLVRAVETVAGRLPERVQTVVLSGEGSFLAEQVLAAQGVFPPCRTVHLDRELRPEISQVACAYAVAVLAANEDRGSRIEDRGSKIETLPSSSILNPRLTVAKVGGSLYDWPDLGPQLRKWLSAYQSETVVLIPGGGAMADVVRDLDRHHELGDDKAHWLALRALSLNAHFLADLLPGACVIDDLETLSFQPGRVWILDPHAFTRADERRHPAGECLPHHWDATSDSVAARVARVLGACRLILLKSTSIPADLDWTEAARLGLVDPHFGRLLPPGLQVHAINLRSGSF